MSSYSTSSFLICQKLDELKACLAEWKSEGKQIGFVPTMGALHQGHATLIQKALHHSDRVIVSLFVNPKQFAPGEDFKTYPRPYQADLNWLKKTKCHCAFIPETQSLYPKEFSTKIHVEGLSDTLEGQFRPDFFIGVATILTKLFCLIQPDNAVFGEKDYQQLCLVKKLVRDLNMNIEILSIPTERDREGLALSSRNAYLSKSELKIAQTLNKTLKFIALNIEQNQSIQIQLKQAKEKLIADGFSKIDYLDLRTETDFQPLSSDRLTCKARLLAALYLGQTRLLDNWPLSSSKP